MLTNVDSSVFNYAESITMLPSVSAEWNHNLFNPPYITVAGTGASISKTLSSGTIASVSSGGKLNFTTKSFNTTNGVGSITYSVPNTTGKAYKIVTYVKTNSAVPLILTASAKGSAHQYGSEQEQVDSLGWTKITTYIGSNSSSTNISSFTYKLSVNPTTELDTSPTVYFTEPDIYETTYFDYRNHSLWPTESPFTYFRPGESYVGSGNSKCSFPSNYRKITSSVLKNYTGKTYSPVSPIIQNPQFFLASPPVPVLKTSLPTNISPYRYFVSDDTVKSITAVYEKALVANKLVLKFNTIMTKPTIGIDINGLPISVDGGYGITLPDNAEGKCTGVLTLYWTGTAWTKTQWSDMPKFSDSGALSKTTTISKITVTQNSKTVNSEFSTYNTQYVTADLNRMQLIEVSPRLEIDLTDFVQSVSVNKSLDSNSTVLPISSLNTNDASITLSGIPAVSANQIVPIFSSQSDQASTILANMLRKNVKFYINYNLSSYTTLGSGTSSPGTNIPGGVFYSDSWTENDIQDVSVQCFDVARYLQSTPVPDYVANLKSVFEIITNILDLAGFTDYDYDSLYSICNNKSAPLDLSYYYCNSQDSTIVDALNQIFVAYQIGAYIDEYGIMKFLSLQNILSSQTSVLSITEANIQQGGLSVSNEAKPGKISLRYQTPKIKQSPSLQNVKNLDIKNSPSFVYTTSNDVVWQQQTSDSVGFNYINQDMSEDANKFNINVNDLQDIFHTFNLNNEGYAVIENEVVSFVHKEYNISNMANTLSNTVSVKNNLELSSEINKFIKEYNVGIRTSYAQITAATSDETSTTYTANNSFMVGDKVSVTSTNPATYAKTSVITEATATSFTVEDPSEGAYLSGGEATIFADYDVLVTPTGNITNVERGLFGTSPSAHNRIITDISSKSLSEATVLPDFTIEGNSSNTAIINLQDSDPSLPSIDMISVEANLTDKSIVFPTSDSDIGYQTYSVKFSFSEEDGATAGLFFNMNAPTSSGAYFVELSRINKTNPKDGSNYSPKQYRYILTVYDADGVVHAWSEVTGECNSIVNNFNKILKKEKVGSKYEYSYVTDNAFNLKLVHKLTDGTDGEAGTVEDPVRAISVFINNIEVVGWQIPGEAYDAETNPDGTGYKSTEINKLTGMRQKPTIPDNITLGTKFGFFVAHDPYPITGLNPEIVSLFISSGYTAALREIHATKKPLFERSVSYFYQDREFLNGIVQDQPLYNNSPTYIMQTTPEVVGINNYDVQYTTPAAVSVDVWPIEYKLFYYPGEEPQDQKSYQTKVVDEYSLSYSTPINTGFRARMAVANNSQHLVYLSKESDATESATVTFNLFTHEIIAPSDPELLERVIDHTNVSEVAQIDSEWIQSKDAAQKTLKLIQSGIEGFSKTVALSMFGNPLIQVGDVVTLSYNLNGMNQQKYMVHTVSQEFSNGLDTSLSLKRIQE